MWLRIFRRAELNANRGCSGVMEFTQAGVQAECLLGYGNWSRAGSKHVTDQMELMSRNELRKVWRDRDEIEANLESRTVL